MMITTFTCDHCGLSQDNSDNMHFIAINRTTNSYGSGTNFHQKLWCTTCCAKFRLFLEPPPVPPPSVTLEDIVREIVREEVNNQ